MLLAQKQALYTHWTPLATKLHSCVDLDKAALATIALIPVAQTINHAPMIGKPATATNVWTNVPIWSVRTVNTASATIRNLMETVYLDQNVRKVTGTVIWTNVWIYVLINLVLETRYAKWECAPILLLVPSVHSGTIVLKVLVFRWNAAKIPNAQQEQCARKVNAS